MLDFLLADPNLVFGVVLALLLVFFAVEFIGLLFGASIQGVLGELDLPDLDMDMDLGVDAGPDLDLGIFTKFLCWLQIGKVPLLVLIVIFMAVFVICGYAIQYLCLLATGGLVPGWLAVPAAVVLSVPVLRVCGRFLTRIIPGDETSAISQSELVGARAVIVLGMAKQGSPAQARTTDRHGTTHYLMVEPDNPDETLEPGRELLLVRHAGNLFFAIHHPEPGGMED